MVSGPAVYASGLYAEEGTDGVVPPCSVAMSITE